MFSHPPEPIHFYPPTETSRWGGNIEEMRNIAETYLFVKGWEKAHVRFLIQSKYYDWLAYHYNLLTPLVARPSEVELIPGLKVNWEWQSTDGRSLDFVTIEHELTREQFFQVLETWYKFRPFVDGLDLTVTIVNPDRLKNLKVIDQS